MYSSAFQAIGHSAAVTIRKISVKAASTSDRAISLGVRWRMAPSTRAIMRSRNDLPALAVIAHDDAVGEDARAAGDAGAVAAGLADHRGRLAGDGRLVDRGHALDDLAVAGDDLAGLDHDHGRPPAGRWRRFPRSSPSSQQAVGRRLPARLAQGVGLGLAAGLGQRRGEVGEQHRQEQPDVQGEQVAERRLALVAEAARRS